MKKLLVKIKKISNKFFGSSVDEFYWKARHLIDREWPHKYLSADSIKHPHREFIIGKILFYYPFDSVLEIGCASGPNIYLLSQQIPDTVKIYGGDISKKAVDFGQRWFLNKGIKNVSLSVLNAQNLEKFSDKSIDIIFSDAALIYLSPDRINKSIKEMLRVAKKAIILNEWTGEFEKSFCAGHWVYNYKKLFSQFIPEQNIKVTKLPENLWGGNWSRFGCVTEIKI